MILYTLATKTHECYGHGDSGTELRIIKEGPWNQGSFPPLFKTPEAAEAYRAWKPHDNREVVGLIVADSP